MVETNRDLQRSFIDPSHDQGTSNLAVPNATASRIEKRNKALVEPSIRVKERQVPGQDGFRLADTPQAWVYIQKKQWTDDTWTYVVEDSDLGALIQDRDSIRVNVSNKSRELQAARATLGNVAASNPGTETTIRRLTAELQALKAELSTKEQQINAEKQLSAQINGQTPEEGKIEMINVRSSLGRIITRKLDWMNTHEQFTKNQSLPDGERHKLLRDEYDYAERSIQTRQALRTFEQLSAARAEIDNVISDINQSSDNLRQGQEELAKSVKSRQDTIATADEELIDLDDQVRELGFEKAGLESRQAAIPGEIANAESNIASLESSIAALIAQEQQAQAAGNTGLATAARAERTAREADKDREEAQLNELIAEQAENQTRIDEINEELPQLETDIAEREQLIEEQERLIIIEEDTAERFGKSIEKNNAEVLAQEISKDKIVRQTVLDSLLQSELKIDPLVVRENLPITFSHNKFTRYYRAPGFKTSDTAEVKAEKARLEELRSTLADSTLALVQEARVTTVTDTGAQRSLSTEDLARLTNLQQEYIDVSREIERISRKIVNDTLVAPIELDSALPVFNGVMELANVNNISTNVNIEGQGSATITLENPQNIFYISRDDIDLALSIDPLLETNPDDFPAGILPNPSGIGRPIGEGDLTYFEGGWYPKHIVQLLRSGRGAGVNIGHLTQFSTAARRAAGLSEEASVIQNQIDTLRQQRDAVFSDTSLTLEQAGLEVAPIDVDLAALGKKLEDIKKAESLARREQLQLDESLSEQRSLLRRYYQGKTIFEPLDRIYVWMTSPTRTPYRLRGINKFAVEDSSVIEITQQRASLITATKEVEDELDKIMDFLTSTASAASTQQGINQVRNFLRNPFGPQAGTATRVALSKLRNIAAATAPGATAVLNAAANAPGVIANIGYTITAGRNFGSSFVGGTVLQQGAELESFIAFLENDLENKRDTLAALERGLNSTDALQSARAFDRISNEVETARLGSPEYNARNIGIEEEKFQVFQGVISSVSRSYSEGKYTITLECRDNLVFLEMSRIMLKPALRRDREPIGVLEDPIWRTGNRAGTWKSGVLVLDHAFINDEIASKINKNIVDVTKPSLLQNIRNNKQSSVTEGRIFFDPLAVTEPFAKVDAANVISLLVTGHPFNTEQFVRNAFIGGRLQNRQKDGQTDQQSEDTSFFAALRRQVGDLNDHLGDFEPFLLPDQSLLSDKAIEDRKKQLEDAHKETIDALLKAYTRYVLNRVDAFVHKLNFDQQNRQRRKAGKPQIEDTECPLTSLSFNEIRLNILQRLGVESKILSRLLDIMQQAVTIAVGSRPSDKAELDRLREQGFQPGDLTASGIAGPASAATFHQQQRWQFIIDRGELVQGRIPVNDKVVREIAGRILGAPSNDLVFGPVRRAIENRVGVDFGSTATAENLIATLLSGEIDLTGQPIDVQKGLQSAQQFAELLLNVEVPFRREYVAAAIAVLERNDFIRLEQVIKDLTKGISQEALKASYNPLQKTPERIIRKEAKNFLVVDDRYAFDQTLQAYVLQIGQNFEVWQSEFESPLSICRRAADQVDFEFYADENGNIQFKPPTYNRLLREHFSLIAEEDIAVRDAVLIRYGDNDGQVLQSIIKGQAIVSEALVEYRNKRNDIAARLDTVSRLPILARTRPTSVKEANQMSALVSGTPLTGPAANTGPTGLTRTTTTQDITQKIRAQLDAQLVNEKSQNRSKLLASSSSKRLNRNEQIDVEVGRRVADIAFVEKARSVELKNEAASIGRQKVDAAGNDTAFKAVIEAEIGVLTKQVALYQNIIGTLEDLGEELSKARTEIRKKTEQYITNLDQFFDEIRIHRLADHDVLSYSLSEGPPRFTRLDVLGSPELIEVQPREIYWSGGVDYDMWRNYGFMFETKQKAYFHSGNTARTYARALLGRERGRIFTGSVQVRGDAKYHVGDCVYLEGDAMYFYVLGVTHSLTYGGNYVTTLQLGYGRRVGEILPHPFDVLGGIYIETYQSDIERALANEGITGLQENVKASTKASANQSVQAQQRGTAVQQAEAVRRFAL